MPSELEILRQRGIAKSLLKLACEEAKRHALDPMEYLVEKNLLPDEAVYSAFAEACGVPYLPQLGFRPQSVNGVPIGLGDNSCGPLLIGMNNGDSLYVIAPEVSQFEDVRRLLEDDFLLKRRIRITTPAALGYATRLLNSPEGELESRFPQFSARIPLNRTQVQTFLIALMAFAVGIAFPTVTFLLCLSLVVAVGGILFGGARLASAWSTRRDTLDYRLPAGLEDPRISWPDYTVLIPLYREAESVPHLLRHLEALDYPPDKLEVLFLLEREDEETRRCLERSLSPALASSMRVVHVPQGSPKTKPRALAYGLEEARGRYVTIYDAEDRPDPQQLKQAALFFSVGPAEVACLQARLAVDNAWDSFFARQFALEYACLFDQLLPWLHKREWPFPLGGTSNHFRKAALLAVGAWDKYNVTEDADLGVRLARMGYRTGVLASTTYEEAPISWHAWWRQRARWHKGWLQTLFVHLRDPGRCLSDLGSVRFFVLIGMLGGSFAMMTLGPLFCLLLGAYALGWIGLPSFGTWGQTAALSVCLSGLLMGLGGGGVALIMAGRRRGYRPGLWDLVCLPVYWGCIGLAFYRAAWEFLRSPHSWSKTEHGVSKTRRPDPVMRGKVVLERVKGIEPSS